MSLRCRFGPPRNLCAPNLALSARLEIVRSGQFPVDAINTGDFRLRRYGNVAIITGWSDYIHAGAVVWSVRHTHVWVHDGQRWRFHLWHGTPRPQ
jgi:hypothetical protein